ncbi:MAG TPA: M56 family metallopeptidase, partial [Chitinophagaceae bacterium]
MPAFFIYLLKANIALTICYLAYRFGLRRLTFYTTNRFFLLFGIAFAALFPLIDLTRLFNSRTQLAGGISHYTPDWNALQQYLQSRDSFTVWDLLQYIFWAGVVVMSVRFFIQLISLWRIHTRSVTGRVKGSRVKIMQQPVNPFSFFRNIYLNPSLHEPEEIAAIIIHEKVHVKGWHSADVMAGELNNIFYWFNPGAWLMKTAIRENLEFIVDRKILQSGMDAKVYQYSLIKVSGVSYAAAIANNFNFSHLKQRIMMMNKKRSGRINILRYILLLPLVTAIALFMFTSSKGQKGITSNNAASVLRSDTVPPAPIPPPPPPAPPELPKAYRDFLNRNPEVDALAWSTPVNGKATVVRVKLKSGTTEKYHLNDAAEIKKGEAKYGRFPVAPLPPPELRKVPPPSPAPVSPPAPPKPKVKFTPPAPPKPKVKFTPPVIARDSEPPVSVYPAPATGREKERVVIGYPRPQNQPLFIVNGKEYKYPLNRINVNDIKSIS